MKHLVWILLLSASFGHADGSGSSGGGKGVVCRGSDGHIQSAEMLDLFEGRVTYGLQIKSLGSTVEENIGAIEKKTEEIFAGFTGSARPLFEKAAKDFHLLPSGITLKPVNDADEDVLPPKGCALEQIAYYQDDQILLVDREIWDALDPLNRAALFTHEVIYRQERSISSSKNSRRARKIVAHLFSDFVFTPVMQGVPPDAKECHTLLNDEPNKHTAFYFYLYPNSEGEVGQIAQFVLIRDQLLYSQSRDVISQWPNTPTDGSSLLLKNSIDPDTIIGLARAYDKKGNALYYYFPEPDGRHAIYCQDRPGNDKSNATLSVSPASPVVFTSDLSVNTPNGSLTVHAPWFNHSISITTKQTITVVGFTETITSPGGTSIVTRNITVSPTQINKKYTTNVLYMGDLPASQDPGYGYEVELSAQGWLGPKNHPGKRLSLKTNFRTQ